MKKLGMSMLAALLLFALVLPASAFAEKSLTSVIKFTVPKYTIAVGETITIQYELDLNASDLTYANIQPESSDKSILAVEDEGQAVKVTGMGKGDASVIFNVYQGYDPYEIPITVVDSGTADLETGDEPVVDEGEEDSEFHVDIPQELQDLSDYAEMLAPLAKYEEAATTAYNRNKFVTSKTRKQAYQVFTYTIIPNYKKFVWGLKQIKAPNQELGKIHAQFLHGAKLQLEGFMLMQKALTKAITVNSFTAANKKLAEGRKYINAFGASLKKYAEKYQPIE